MHDNESSPHHLVMHIICRKATQIQVLCHKLCNIKCFTCYVVRCFTTRTEVMRCKQHLLASFPMATFTITCSKFSCIRSLLLSECVLHAYFMFIFPEKLCIIRVIHLEGHFCFYRSGSNSSNVKVFRLLSSQFKTCLEYQI